MASPKRIRLFKIISAVIVLLLLLWVVLMIRDVHTMPGINAYALNDSINQRNARFASNNPFGFTDIIRTPTKPKGIYRIAVLGDSFIWGDGLPYQQTWNHKLEQKILAGYDSMEVLHWGKCGWSTLDELNFYKQHGKDYNIDLLIIGWVDNDPDVGKWPQVKHVDPVTRYPITSKWLPSLAQRWANSEEEDWDKDWMDSLYTDGNLKEYGKVLDELHSQNIKIIYIMTPGSFFNHGETKRHYELGQAILRKAGFNCYNLYPTASKALAGYSKLQLQANPVNMHPGAIMTEEFASEVFSYLKNNGYLKK